MTTRRLCRIRNWIVFIYWVSPGRREGLFSQPKIKGFLSPGGHVPTVVGV